MKKDADVDVGDAGEYKAAAVTAAVDFVDANASFLD